MKYQNNNKNYAKQTLKTIFRQIGGVWQSVNTENPQLFCEWIAQNQIQFDDTCVFARYEFYEGKHLKIKTTITIKHNGGTITTNTNTNIV